MKEAILVSILVIFVIGCHRSDDDVIHEKDPFFVEQITTPDVSKKILVDLSQEFAKRHGMRVEHSFSHFKDSEYSVILIRDDINIVSSNVGRGRNSLITAYSKHSELADRIRYSEIIDQYKCDVFQDCRLR